MAKNTDWEAIEREYRAGQLSVVEIGRQHGVSHTAINKRAKKEGWKRDLSAKVRAEVSARLVSPEVSAANAEEAIETAAARGVELVRQHRASLAHANRIVSKLLHELERGTDNIEDIEAEIETETAEDRGGKRRAMMLKAVSLPTRANTATALTQALKNLIPLERQAFKLDEDTPPDPTDEEATSRYAMARRIAFALAGAR